MSLERQYSTIIIDRIGFSVLNAFFTSDRTSQRTQSVSIIKTNRGDNRNVSKILTEVSTIKFHENPAAAVAVIHGDVQAATKKSPVAFRDCFAKAFKMGKDRERISNGERDACSLKDRTKES